MGWAMLYLFVFLKLPIAALAWIVWWAAHQTPETSEEPGGDGGAKRRPHPPRPLPRRPRRRGPHGEPAPLPPPRVRTVAARARLLER